MAGPIVDSIGTDTPQQGSSSCQRCGALLSDADVECSSCGEVRHALEPTVLKRGFEVFDGKWAVEGKIGQGGMGTVYVATDLQLDRKVAIKMLSPAICQDASMVARFEREAKMMAKLDHPNLVPIHAVGRHNEVPFIVMKLLDGKNLSDHIKEKAPLPISEMLQIMRQVCGGLGFVHTRGFIHRDIKPANIFIAPDGHVTILDLGVAHDPKSTMTRSGMMIGTPRYMAPEQVLGMKIDHRSDLYALGVVLYEMLTGKAPFDGDSDFSVMKAHTDVPVPDPAADLDLPLPVAAVAMRALAKKAEDRYQSAAELFQALQAASQPDAQAEAVTQPRAKTVVSRPPRRQVKVGPVPEGSPSEIEAQGRATTLTAEPPRATQPSHAPFVRRSSTPFIVIGGVVTVLIAGGVALMTQAQSPTSDPKPVEVMPREVKPREVKPVEVKPVEVKPVEVKPAEVKPAEVKPAEVKPSGVKPTGIKPRPAIAPDGPGEVLVSVTVKGVPNWAWLDVDGLRQGATPKKVKLPAGKHLVHLERVGFKPLTRQLEIIGGETTKLPLELEPQ